MQFDVFVNPIPSARAVSPYVTVLQSDLAETGRDRIVAFMTLASRLQGKPRKLIPVFEFEGHLHALILPAMTTLPVKLLRESIGNISEIREKIVSGLDELFLGI